MAISVVVLAVVAVVLFAFAAAGIKIVRPYQKGIVEQLGRYKATVDPGLKLIIPVIQSITRVDMREQVIDVPPQEVITKDNVTVTVDAVIYYEPTDAQRLIYNVANFMLAVTKLAQTNLRNVIGDMTLDNALTSRDNVNVALREVLDDATDKWGVKVVRVEIQRIDPPTDVMNAMHEQMKAERNRRAVVLEADGTREAAITRAEGDKQSVILAAEGVRQQAILQAEGEADADAEKQERLEQRDQRVVIAHPPVAVAHGSEGEGVIQTRGQASAPGDRLGGLFALASDKPCGGQRQQRGDQHAEDQLPLQKKI